VLIADYWLRTKTQVLLFAYFQVSGLFYTLWALFDDQSLYGSEGWRKFQVLAISLNSQPFGYEPLVVKFKIGQQFAQCRH
jgi:hypothetical protein